MKSSPGPRPTSPAPPTPAPLPILFLPGSLCDEFLWRHQIDAFRNRVELRVGDLTQDDNIAAMAERILTRFAGPFAVIGHSMGAYVAFELLRQAPERIRRLVLAGASARPDAPAETSRRQDLLAMPERVPFRGITPPLMALLSHMDWLSEVDLTREIEA